MTEFNPKDLAALHRVPLHLLPSVTSIWGAMACLDGAVKYGPYNWRQKPIRLMPYVSACERHFSRYKGGEDFDSKSKVHALGHVIATCGILLDAEMHGTLIDDRPDRPRGEAESRLLDHLEELCREKTKALAPPA